MDDYPEIYGMPLKTWIDKYYEDISVSELEKDLLNAGIDMNAKNILDSMEKDGFCVSPVFGNNDRYRVVV